MFFQYNTAEKLYQLENLKKLNNHNEKGKIIEFSADNCSLKAFGELNLGLQLSYLSVKYWGELLYEGKNNSLSLQTDLALEIPFFEQKVAALLANSWEKDKRLKPIAASNLNHYKKVIQEVTEEKDYLKWLENFKNGVFSVQNFPKSFLNSFIFSDITWTWKKIAKLDGFISENVLNLPRLGKYKLGKRLPGAIFLNLTKQHVNDRIVVLIMSKDIDIYLDYQEAEGILYVYSKKENFYNSLKKELGKLKTPTQKNQAVPYQIVTDLPENGIYQQLEKYIQAEEDTIPIELTEKPIQIIEED